MHKTLKRAGQHGSKEKHWPWNKAQQNMLNINHNTHVDCKANNWDLCNTTQLEQDTNDA